MRDARDTKVQAASRAQIARAWLELERLKREIRMKPKPKPVDVGFPVRSKKPRSSVFTEPSDARLSPAPAKTITEESGPQKTSRSEASIDDEQPPAKLHPRDTLPEGEANKLDTPCVPPPR